jgi:hypothetical protein
MVKRGSRRGKRAAGAARHRTDLQSVTTIVEDDKRELNASFEVILMRFDILTLMWRWEVDRLKISKLYGILTDIPSNSAHVLEYHRRIICSMGSETATYAYFF